MMNAPSPKNDSDEDEDEPSLPLLTKTGSEEPTNLSKQFNDTIKYEDNNGKPGSIVSYNALFLLLVGWLFPRTGSIFTWVEMLIIMGVLSSISTGLAYWSCDVFKDEEKCIHLPTADTQLLTLITLCSFVMAFFANIIFQRWWAIRLNLQTCMGSALNIAMNYSTVVTSALAKVTEAQIEPARITANRINGMCILAFRFLLNNARNEKEISDLVEDGYILENEMNYFLSQPNQNAASCCQIILVLIQESARNHWLGDAIAASTSTATMTQNVMDLRGSIAMAETYVNVQIPYPFVQMVAFIVFAFLLQLLLVCSAFIAVGISQPERKGELVTGYITLLLYSIVLLGLLKLFDTLSNPLGDDPADFPVKTYLENFEKTLYTITSNAFHLRENNFEMGKIKNKSFGMQSGKPKKREQQQDDGLGPTYGSLRHRKDSESRPGGD